MYLKFQKLFRRIPEFFGLKKKYVDDFAVIVLNYYVKNCDCKDHG